MIWVSAWLEKLAATRLRRRRRAQQRRTRESIMYAWVRLDEARRYVDRDRAAERKERDRLILQRQAARERLAELEDLLRAYISGQSLLDAEAAAKRAREALASGFGGFDEFVAIDDEE